MNSIKEYVLKVYDRDNHSTSKELDYMGSIGWRIIDIHYTSPCDSLKNMYVTFERG